ncbi:MAG: cupredoxin domain-containing protein [Actinomycetota bacterium]|nr:cupredoxin domain-containing protein [Actinomycetota bacterium]
MAVLATVAALGACSPETEPSRDRVEISIHHSAFRPSEVEVARGTTVTFVISNDDPIDHEFILGDEEVQERHEKGTEPHHGAKPGEISIPAEETRRTTFTFSEEGTFIFGCHLPGHYDFGMRGTVTVI